MRELVVGRLGVAGWKVDKVGVLVNVGVVAVIPVGGTAELLLSAACRIMVPALQEAEGGMTRRELRRRIERLKCRKCSRKSYRPIGLCKEEEGDGKEVASRDVDCGPKTICSTE